MSDLRERFAGVRVPGEDEAYSRARAAVLAAHAEAAPAPAPARRLWRPATALAVGLLLAAALATAPGRAVGDWLRDAVRPRPAATPAPPADALPGRGRLLAAGAGGISLTGAGDPSLLGPFRDATWSPRGRFAAVTTGRRLLAVTPAGTVRWRVTPPAPPRHPRWAPDGFRLAYLAGPQLRVVVGDGTDDRLFWGHALDVAPAFRPTAGHTVAWLDSARHVRVADVDRAVLEWRSPDPVPAGARALSWSPDGRRLLVAGGRQVTLLTPGRAAARELRFRGRVTAAAFPPSGDGAAAVLVRSGRRSSIRLLESSVALIATSGRYRGLVWSPDARWLITRWGDRWLLVDRDGRRVSTTEAHGTPVAWGP